MSQEYRPRKCKHCGSEFQPTRFNQIYCKENDCYRKVKQEKARLYKEPKEAIEQKQLTAHEEAEAFREYYKELTGREFVSKEKVGGTEE